MKQKEIAKRQTAQDFVNVYAIEDGILYSKDDNLFGYIVVRCVDDTLMGETEFNSFIDSIYNAMHTNKEPFQIISIPKTIDITSIINNLLRQKSKAQTIEKTALLNDEIEYVKSMVTNDDKEPLIFIKIWDKWIDDNSPKKFKERLQIWDKNLKDTNGINSHIMNTAEIVSLCKIYAELNVYQGDEEDTVEQGKVKQKKIKRKEKANQAEDNSELLNMITPIGGLQFKIAETIVGSSIGKISAVIRFPSELRANWLKRIVNSTNSITAITYTPDKKNEIPDGISKNVKQSILNADTSKNMRQIKRYEKEIRDADEIFTEVDEKNKEVGFISILTMPFSEDEEMLAEISRYNENLFRQQKMKIKCLGNLQKQGYMTMSPYYLPQTEIEAISKRVFMLETLSGSGAMNINNFKDETGYYFGRTSDMENDDNKNTAIILDMFKRGNDRTNSNFFVVGKSGTGKSTSIKSIIQILYMQGVKLLIIDPETEYKELVKNLGGSWLNTGGGSSSINILEVRQAPQDEEDEDKPLFENGVSALALHIRVLEMFFSVYKPQLTDIQKALLKKALIETYEKFGITWDTDVTKLSPKDYPIMSDVYEHIKQSLSTEPLYKELYILLTDIAEGADSFIWNKRTNIDTDNQVICFDTQNLSNISSEVKAAQYFNILAFCWDIVSKDKTTPVAIIADEAHLMAQEDTMKYMRNISKRCRKYEGMLGIITQNISDMLAPRIAEFSKDLIDAPTYKFIFGMDATNLKETSNLFYLSDVERDTLIKCERGKCIAFIGSQKLKMNFVLPQYRMDLMGKAGGR